MVIGDSKPPHKNLPLSSPDPLFWRQIAILKILIRELCGAVPCLDFRGIVRVSKAQVLQQVPEWEK